MMAEQYEVLETVIQHSRLEPRYSHDIQYLD